MKDWEIDVARSVGHKSPAKYALGDEVYIKSRHAGEPDDIGIVAEVTDCGRHFYYNVDYIDSSGRGMRIGTPEEGLRGHVRRVEKVINPVLTLVKK